MAVMSNLSLTNVSGQTHAYTIVSKQNGTLPSAWERGHASGTLMFADVISHNVSVGAQNRNVSVRAVLRKIGPDPAGLDSILFTQSCDVKFSFPKASTTADRTTLIDTIISALTNQKAALISTESYT